MNQRPVHAQSHAAPALWRMAGFLAAPLVRALLHWRAGRGKEDRARLSERFGDASLPRPSGRLVWVHGASIGEVLSALPLVHRILANDPAVNVLITSGTVTSAQLIARQMPERCRHQFVPVDVPGAVDKFMAHWQPDVVLWLESDFWPLLLATAKASGARIALIQGRVSPRSFRRWRAWPGVIGPILASFECVLAQSAEDQTRLGLLGADPVFFVGNLKAAAAPLAVDPKELLNLRAAIGQRAVWLAASTHPSEEEQVLAARLAMLAQHTGLLTIIVPRHPERGDSVAALARAQGLKVVLRSQGGRIESNTDLLVADTLGELGLFYRLADVVFVGGSLVPHGGQNPLEPARLDCAILHGPWVQNFADIYQGLDSNDAALPIADAQALGMMASELLQDAARRTSLAKAAHRFASASDTRVVDQVMEKIASLMAQGSKSK